MVARKKDKRKDRENKNGKRLLGKQIICFMFLCKLIYIHTFIKR